MVASEASRQLARAAALLDRAQGLISAGLPSSLDNQVTVISAAVRDVHVELRAILSGLSDRSLAAIALALDAESSKLDVIERQLGSRGGADAQA